MRDYMLGIFLISLILGVFECIMYKSGSKGERFAFGVLIAFAVLSPLEGLVGSGDWKFPEYSPEYSDTGEYKERAKEAFEEGIKKEIADSFRINKEDIRVKTKGFSFEKMRAEKIYVTLSLKAAGADPKRVKEHIEGFGVGDCEVNFEIG